MEKSNKYGKGFIEPLLVGLFLIFIDQAFKTWIVHISGNIYSPQPPILWSFGGDFFQLIHARNTGVAFSLGAGLPGPFRILGFIFMPLVVLTVVLFMYFRDKTLTSTARWALALIIAGGLGNILDRIFRPEGVVDMFSVWLPFPLWGDRFPTFNVADSCVTLGGILLVLTLIWTHKKPANNP